MVDLALVKKRIHTEISQVGSGAVWLCQIRAAQFRENGSSFMTPPNPVLLVASSLRNTTQTHYVAGVMAGDARSFITLAAIRHQSRLKDHIVDPYAAIMSGHQDALDDLARRQSTQRLNSAQGKQIIHPLAAKMSSCLHGPVG